MTFERHVDVDWKGSVMEGQGGEGRGGAFSLRYVPLAYRRAGRKDQPKS